MDNEDLCTYLNSYDPMSIGPRMTFKMVLEGTIWRALVRQSCVLKTGAFLWVLKISHSVYKFFTSSKEAAGYAMLHGISSKVIDESPGIMSIFLTTMRLEPKSINEPVIPFEYMDQHAKHEDREMHEELQEKRRKENAQLT